MIVFEPDTETWIAEKVLSRRVRVAISLPTWRCGRIDTETIYYCRFADFIGAWS
jgi:hypothetical protein